MSPPLSLAHSVSLSLSHLTLHLYLSLASKSVRSVAEKAVEKAQETLHATSDIPSIKVVGDLVEEEVCML